MKTKLLILFCSLAWSHGFAQNQSQIDSVKQALAAATSDSSRIELLDRLRLKYLDYKNDSALYYTEQAIAIAENNNIKLNTARLLGGKAYVLMHLGRFSESFRVYRQAFDLAENPANETREWFGKSPHEDRLNTLAWLHHNFGHLMGRINNTDKQIAHYREAEKLAKETGDTSLLGFVYMNLGPIYLHKFDEPDSALQLEQEALKVFTQTGQKKYMGVVFWNLGHVYNRKNENRLAVEHFYKAVQAGRETNNFRLIFWGYSDLADFYINGQNRDSSLFYAQKMGSLVRMQSAGLPENAAGLYYAALSKSYALSNQTDSAFKYLNLAYPLKDSTYQSQIKKLTDVQNLSFEEQLQAEQLEKEKVTLQTRVRQYALLGGLGLVLLVAFFLYRNTRQKQKANVVLQSKNRELEVEAALERVRSRAMAMHNSEELGAVIFTLFQQLAGLNIKIVTSWVTLMDTVRNELTIWVAHIEGEAKPGIVKNTDFETFKQEMEDWKSGQDNFLAIPSAIARAQVKKIFGFDIHPPDEAPFWYLNQSWNRFGYIGLSTWEPTGEEEKNIISRFSKVFEQTYTRFLDIQKAEEQAREAQIEAALERVRARTMAMHKSEELPDIIKGIYQEFEKFRITGQQTDIEIYIIDEATGMSEAWATDLNMNRELTNFPFSWTITEATEKEYLSWKNTPIAERKNLLINTVFSGASWQKILTDFEKDPGLKEIVQNFRTNEITQWATHHAFFSHGVLTLQQPDPIRTENLPVLQRFAKVFEQTYTRFLDLQNAEAQAREAQIEAALERVRSRAMAMRHSDELSEAAELLYNEFLKLGVVSFSCGYLINDDENAGWKIWLTNPGEKFFKEFWTAPYTADHNLRARYESWKRQEDFHCAVLEGEENRAHHVVVSRYAPWKTDMLDALPPRLVFNSAHFSLGHLLVISPDKLAPELEQAMVRFAGAFDLAYRRFLDLQIAEEQAALIKQEKERLEKTLNDLQATQAQLIQSEKLASLGELTAGIAHEIQNPLNFVNNFSELSVGLAEEIREEISKPGADKTYLDELLGDLSQNQQKINHHGKRAAAIVTGMLQHARTSTGQKEPTDLNALADEYLRLAYHGLRAKDATFNAKIVTDLDPNVGLVNVVPQDIGRVFLNIINNAFYATQQAGATLAVAQQTGDRDQGDREGKGDREGRPYEPTVSVTSRRIPPSGGQGAGWTEFRIKDNGTGIPDDVRAKIFQPFFTTKPTGEGTGLGLSLAYDIVVKGHGGTLEVETAEGEGTEFIIQLSDSKQFTEP